MNRKRSPMDMVNAGRRRKPAASLEDLDRMLARMEGREARPAPERPPSNAGRGWSRSPAPSPSAAQGSYRSAYDDAARGVETFRRRHESHRDFTAIAQELQDMREELRTQVRSGLQREFDVIRAEMKRVGESAPQARPEELSAEFQRLSDAVEALSERSNDKGINLLRLELEQVRSTLANVAREETVKSVDRRWDEFDRKWSAFENRVQASDDGADLKALSLQIERITGALGDLPDSRAIKALEDKVRQLSASVDEVAAHHASLSPQALGLIEERLDEISRAIVASSAAAQPVSFDIEPFERIEARMSSLAGQIHELLDERPVDALSSHIGQLSQRVEEIAQRIEIPETMVERLADQMATIVQKLDRDAPAADLDLVFHNLESRFEHLSSMLERRQDDAMEQGQQLFRELERRLGEVANRLDDQESRPLPDNSHLLQSLDARFSELAVRLDESQHRATDFGLRGLEERLDDISSRLERSNAASPGPDTEIIRHLEGQIAELSARLSQSQRSATDDLDFAPRLDEIERAIASSHESVLETARQVAQDAARAMATAPSDSAGASELADELRALDALTRRSDERNARTFEAIHDTLLKIVDRLGTLESVPGPRHSGLFTTKDTPGLEPDDEAVENAGRRSSIARSPSEAAAAAAHHARGEVSLDEVPADNRPRSMLGGLSRAFSGFREKRESDAVKADPVMKAAAEIEGDLDAPLDPREANRPLEPGSGAPDLNAIMRRVREEHETDRKRTGADAAKSDFIAAARRAAQAAAAEAEMAKRGSGTPAKDGKSKLGGLLKMRRKTMLLAATGIIVVLAGMQLSSAFLSDSAPSVASISAEEDDMVAAYAPAADLPDVTNARQLAFDEPASRTDLVGAASPEAPGIDATAAEMAPTPSAPATVLPAERQATPRIEVEEPASPRAELIEPAEIGPADLRAAADDGDPKAMFEIASRYAEGRGTQADNAKAAQWYERAADLGLAPAQYRIGNFLEKGIGVERDIPEAKRWYTLAAEQGNASAMHNLAVLLAMGADGPPDNETAAHWFVEAADLGVRDSQFNLGILAARGAGVPQSLEESYKWFALVAEDGDRDAAEKRDEIAKALRPEQLESARTAVEQWRPRPLDQESNIVNIPDEWTEDGMPTASIDMGRALTNIQTILNNTGYDAGPADGVMGARTRSAILAFQKDNGLEPDGAVSEELVTTLLQHQ